MRICIMEMEFDLNLPHWLTPGQRYRDKVEAIREKHRARALEKRRAETQKTREQ